MRFAAPKDVSGIILSSGPLTVEGGFVEVPDDAGAGDLGGLAVNGFVRAPDEAPAVSAPDEAPSARAPRGSSSSTTTPAERPESDATK